MPEIEHTPTPWHLMSVGQSFRICTVEGWDFVAQNHYLAGAPFVATINDDFRTKIDDGEIQNPDLALANAQFIILAVNSHADLVALAERISRIPENEISGWHREVIAKSRAVLEVVKSHKVTLKP